MQSVQSEIFPAQKWKHNKEEDSGSRFCRISKIIHQNNISAFPRQYFSYIINGNYRPIFFRMFLFGCLNYTMKR